MTSAWSLHGFLFDSEAAYVDALLDLLEAA